jgi:benzoyl-CoA 2,3-dioxygenase component B
VQRVVKRACELMKQGGGDVRAQRGIDLPTIQKYLNLWYSLSLDLFGGEVSSNAANYFASGVKGRAKEASYPDHIALEGTYGVDEVKNGELVHTDVPLRNAMNEVLRDEYVEDCQRGVDKWNRTIAQAGIQFEFKLPHRRFHRHVGLYQNASFDPQGQMITKEEFDRRKGDWLPSDDDKAYVRSLMTKPIYDPKQMANWIAPPKIGIKGKPIDFEYVHVHHAD